MTSPLRRDTDPDNRFCYWRGGSGRRYIHTVYPVRGCPPLPGAVFVAVQRIGTLRVVLDLGLLATGSELRAPRSCDEIHVHLLSGSRAEAEATLADLKAGLAASDAPGFAEAA